VVLLPMERAPKWVPPPQCRAPVATSPPCRGVAKLRWLEGCLLVSWGCLGPCWPYRMAGPPVCRLPWDPKSTCRHEMRQIQLDAYVSNRGEPVKTDPGMMSLVR
jgi:hypothetical protein